MIKRLFLFICGWVKVTSWGECSPKLSELMRRFAVQCHKVKKDREGRNVYVLPVKEFGKIKKELEKEEFDVTVGAVRGLPHILFSLLRRPGIVVGVLFFIVVTVMSGRIIWNIEIKGNEKVSDGEIISLLEELGCSYGDDFRELDFDKLNSDFLVRSENISWISVNMTGNCAMVQVRELRPGGSGGKTENVGSNIVAAENGQIMLIKTEAGEVSVNNGDVVKKGDLLISGVVPLREGGVRFEYAKGEALAYVSRIVDVSIPLKTTKKVYTGEEMTKKSVKIFKKSINLFLNYGIEYTTYDKIVESERFYLFGVIPMPVWVDKVTYREYRNSEAVLDVDAAVSAGIRELRSDLDDILETCEIVRVKQICDISDGGVTLKMELLCITDIAETVEFTTEVPPDPTAEQGERKINGSENNNSQ